MDQISVVKNPEDLFCIRITDLSTSVCSLIVNQNDVQFPSRFIHKQIPNMTAGIFRCRKQG